LGDLFLFVAVCAGVVALEVAYPRLRVFRVIAILVLVGVVLYLVTPVAAYVLFVLSGRRLP
jgi:hypothetical protein